MLTHIGPPNRTGRKNFELLKIQDCGRPLFSKQLNRYIPATVRHIAAKFGMTIHIIYLINPIGR